VGSDSSVFQDKPLQQPTDEKSCKKGDKGIGGDMEIRRESGKVRKDV
jgi:hypothetical protein